MAVRNLAYELHVAGSVSSNLVKELSGASKQIQTLDNRSVQLRETLVSQNAELKQMRGAGLQGTDAYERLRASAAATRDELGKVGQEKRRAIHQDKLQEESTKRLRETLTRSAAVVGAIGAAYLILQRTILGAAREQRDFRHDARLAAVDFYDYATQAAALTLALDGNRQAGLGASKGLIEMARQGRLFSQGLADIDTSPLSLAGIALEDYLGAARDASGRELEDLFRRQYLEIQNITDETERQHALDALRLAIGDQLFALAEKQAGMTEDQIAENRRWGDEYAGQLAEIEGKWEDLNRQSAKNDLILERIKVRAAGITFPLFEHGLALFESQWLIPLERDLKRLEEDLANMPKEWADFWNTVNPASWLNDFLGLQPDTPDARDDNRPGWAVEPDFMQPDRDGGRPFGPSPDEMGAGQAPAPPRDNWMVQPMPTIPESARPDWRRNPYDGQLRNMGMEPRIDVAAPSVEPIINVDVPAAPAAPSETGGSGPQSVTEYNGNNTFYVTIESVGEQGLTPEEAGQKSVEAMDYWLQRSTASR